MNQNQNHNQTKNEDEKPVREQYQAPQLKRWGTLRELTQGGGGNKSEAVTKNKTRF